MNQAHDNPLGEEAGNNQSIENKETVLDQIVKTNMMLYRQLGFNVTKESFKMQIPAQQHGEHMEEQFSQDFSSEVQNFSNSYQQYQHYEYQESQFMSQYEIQQFSNPISSFSQNPSEIFSNYDYEQSNSHYASHQQERLFQMRKKRQAEIEFTKIPDIIWSNAAKITKSSSIIQYECPICLQQYAEGNIVKLMKCNHSFHGQCIKEWMQMNDTCPSCRNKIGK